MLIIQHIITTWQKSSRGMPNAAERSGIPSAFTLPNIHTVPNTLLVQKVNASDASDNYQKLLNIPHKSTNTKNLWEYHGLRFEQDIAQPNSITVFFRYNYHHHGQPKRHSSQVFLLENNDTAVLKINGRYTYYSGQFYQQHTFNLLYSNEPELQQDTFFTTEPKRTQDFLAHLF